MSLTPKYAPAVQLGDAVVELIRNGALKPGDRVLPEQQLVSVAGMSLGTVQKALNRLAIEGWVIRKHGHGTFFANPERPVTEVWHYQYLDHFRFRDRDAQRLLPVHRSKNRFRVLHPANHFWGRFGRVRSPD